MTETANLHLPLVQPSQAQKHVTVNEALVRLDRLAQLSLVSRTVSDPPSVVEGACFGVPAGATGAWAGQEGQVALASNGGWVFAQPKLGWRAWVQDTAQELRFDGADWAVQPMTQAGNGAFVRAQTYESVEDIAAGGAQDLSLSIPAKTMVLAASARVAAPITGTLTGWRLGVLGSEDRFGAGLGLGAGSYADGILGMPLTEYVGAPLRITPEGGDFSGGQIRVALHVLAFGLPA